ncbi:MAG TPA: SDR family oxidoreductase [Pirellulales bacterium]|nr:SDR family oxidoreductase [Pirellulales bacterium]
MSKPIKNAHLQELHMALNDEGPVALVTGSGAPRIGNCVVRRLAAHGYRVILHAHRSRAEATASADELRSQGIAAGVVLADLRDEIAVREMTRQAHSLFGRIDALVNCAGVWRSRRLEEVTAADVREHFEVNALATFLCCQQIGLIMVEQPSGGAIVNCGDWAIERPYLHYAAYFPSKGAIPALTRDFAIELASRNPRVRVNAVLPGPVMIPESVPDKERRVAIERTLVKREGSPVNVADAVLFLLGNEFVTGVCLPVDGGRTIYTAEGR